MIQYIPGGIYRASFKFCMGKNYGRKWRGVKGMKLFSVHFNVYTPMQIFSDPDPTFQLVSAPDQDPVCKCVRLLIITRYSTLKSFIGECIFFDKKEFIFINRAFC
jgi:hypothetical protein